MLPLVSSSLLRGVKSILLVFNKRAAMIHFLLSYRQFCRVNWIGISSVSCWIELDWIFDLCPTLCPTLCQQCPRWWISVVLIPIRQ